MKILGCDLHAKQQTIAMVDTETGEFTEKTLRHEGNEVREFYAALEGRVVVGIEATGAMQWFLELLEGLGMVCRVGHPAKIRAAETRKQKHDRRDAVRAQNCRHIHSVFTGKPLLAGDCGPDSNRELLQDCKFTAFGVARTG